MRIFTTGVVCALVWASGAAAEQQDTLAEAPGAETVFGWADPTQLPASAVLFGAGLAALLLLTSRRSRDSG